MGQKRVDSNDVKKPVDSCILRDLKAANPQLFDEFRDVITRFKEKNDLDEHYADDLLGFLTEIERPRPPHQKRRKNGDDISEDEDNDPQIELLFRCLKPHGKQSHVLEKDMKDGLSRLLMYEGEASSDEESASQPRRILRSAMKHKDRVSNERDDKKNEKVTRMDPSRNKRGENEKTKTVTRMASSRNKTDDKKVENVKLTTNGKKDDPDNCYFYNTYRTVNELAVLPYRGHDIVYHNDDNDESHQVQEETDDGSFSDVEILEPFVMKESSAANLEDPTMELGFRQKVIDLLRRPYDKEEHDKLWLEFEQRIPGQQHKELRNNRDRSCSTNRDGKSYLDHFPDLGRKLRLWEDDKPKCLNLLRGLFFWLQNTVQVDSFQPWQDEECLAIKSESC